MLGQLSTPILCACALTLALSGCTTVQFVELREKPPNPILERLTQTAYGGPGPSAQTWTFLHNTDYSGASDFAPMLIHSRNEIGGEQHLDALRASAEISYLAARSANKNDRGLAMELCLDAARYSWIRFTESDSAGRIKDPNAATQREAVEIYNTSLQELLRLAKISGDYKLGQPIRMPISQQIVNVDVPYPSPWISRDQLGEFDFVSNYELKNLRNRHTKPGVGVPIMVRRARSQSCDPLESYYAEGLSLPVTVVAEFAPSSWERDPDEEITIQLLDPRETDGIVVNDNLLPLESDLSTPLAWYLTDPKKKLLETFAFFRSDKAQHLEGLHMITPFDPDRIPVLMVHGIWSSPTTWMEMFNDLQSDPAIRDKYQFWFYQYPTGEPLTFAAANLRDRLKEMRIKCDPHGQNEKLDQTVVVGHSMGGLMAYLLTIDSEDKLWNGLSKLPVDQIQGDQDTHNQIRRVFFFETDGSIDRVVTIAAPFNGSGYSNKFTRWLGGSLVSLPNTTSNLSELIFRQNNQSMWDRIFAPRTSLDSLNKNSAVLSLVNQTTAPDEVRHHNIVGVNKGRSLEDWTDGVVRLRSASRNDVDSQVQVTASHGEVQRHPKTIAEVRRVLMEHLEVVSERRHPVKAVNHATPHNETSQATILIP